MPRGMPAQEAAKAVIDGVTLPRLAVAAGTPALRLVLACLKTLPPAIDLGRHLG